MGRSTENIPKADKITVVVETEAIISTLIVHGAYDIEVHQEYERDDMAGPEVYRPPILVEEGLLWKPGTRNGSVARGVSISKNHPDYTNRPDADFRTYLGFHLNEDLSERELDLIKEAYLAGHRDGVTRTEEDHKA